MIIALLLSGLVLLALPGRLLAGGVMTSRERAKLAVLGLALGAVIVEAGLLLLVLPLVLRGVDLSGVARSCERVTGLWPLDGFSGGLVRGGAFVFAFLIAGAAIRCAWSARRAARSARIGSCLGEHAEWGSLELVILDTARLLAVGVPSRRPQVVVSRRLVDCLDQEELDAVVRHEAAHLTLCHRRYLLTARIVGRAFAALPFVTASTEAIDRALEQWADAEVLRGSVDRRRALCGALLGLSTADPGVRSRAAGARLLERARALVLPVQPRSRTTRLSTYGALGGTGLAAVALLVGWTAQAPRAFAAAGC